MPVRRLWTAAASLAGNRTVRESGVLMAAQGGSMVLSFAFTVLVTRSLDVAEYGTFRYAMTFLAMMMSVLQLGWPQSVSRLLALEGERHAQRRLVGASVMLLLAASGIGTVATALVVGTAGASGHPLPWILLWVSPFLYLTLGQQFLNSIGQGLSRIELLAAQQLLPYTILLPVTAVQVLLIRSYSLRAALVGYVVVFTLVVVTGFVHAGCSFDSWREPARAIGEENRRTGLPLYIGGLFGVASAQLIALLVAEFSTPREYGQYALALAVSGPLGVLVSSIGTVIFRSSVGRHSLSNQVVGYSLGFGGVLAGTFWAATELLLPRVFGEQYRASVPMAQAMAAGAIMIGWGDIFQRFLTARGRGRALGVVSVCTGIVGLVSAALLFRAWGVWGAIASAFLASATYLGLNSVLYAQRPVPPMPN